MTKSPSPDDEDDALDEAAQGQGLTSDENDDDEQEIDEIGNAAGVPDDERRPFHVNTKDGRDENRWENDPRSKDPE